MDDYQNYYIILLDSSSVRDTQINFKDSEDNNFEDWNGDIVIDKVTSESLEDAIGIVAEEYEINPDKLYGYQIV
jgi:hypothetical protein